MKNTRHRIGYFCNLAPVEIFSAAGLQPVRVSGKAETTAAAEACLCSKDRKSVV